MADKQVTDAITDLAPSWVYWFSLLAGFVGFLEEIKPEDPHKVKFLKFVTRSTSSSLAGLLTWRAGLAMGMSLDWLVVMVGIGAHAGVETLRWLGDLWKRKFLGNDAGKAEKE